MIQSFSIFNGNNFPESYLSKVFTLSSNLSYVAAPGTARHCYVETVTLRLARSQQNIITERRCALGILAAAAELNLPAPHVSIITTQLHSDNKKIWARQYQNGGPTRNGWIIIAWAIVLSSHFLPIMDTRPINSSATTWDWADSLLFTAQSV